jgi:hypothetical protein
MAPGPALTGRHPVPATSTPWELPEVSLRPAEDVPCGSDLAAPRRAALHTTLPVAGVASVATGMLLILLLHVVPPSDRIDPLTRTISEYALGPNAWMFNIGVLALAAGSVAVLASLALAGVVRPVSPASLLVLGWASCLVALVMFQKYDYNHAHSAGAAGMIHRMASLVAFLCLPAGALLTARAGRRDSRWRRPAARTRWAALIATALLCLLFYAVGQGFFTGIPWWRVFPLGAMERLIALAEVGVMFALGGWAFNTVGAARCQRGGACQFCSGRSFG